MGYIDRYMAEIGYIDRVYRQVYGCDTVHRAEKVHRKNGQKESVRIERGKLYGEM